MSEGIPGGAAVVTCAPEGKQPSEHGTMPLTKAGRYELREELGRGAMGVVYKGFDPMIRRTVAIKTMRLNEEGTGMEKPELITRFQTEARAAGVLTHPNIVTVYDAGEESGVFYITMEFVEGRSLQALMDQKQTFPLPRLIKIMDQACQALDFAHQHSIVHRDVKPANIMLTSEDIAKVTDFGTAKIMQLGTTQTGSIIGTPSYMSPEQVKGKVVDGRSDIFSLGVILYELVTGEKPFPGQNVTTVIYKIVNEEPIPPRDLDSSVHPGLSYVISKALAKNPDLRYQGCREMSEDLRNYRELSGAAEAAGPDPFAQTVVMLGRPKLPNIPTVVSGTGALSHPPPPPKPEDETLPPTAAPPFTDAAQRRPAQPAKPAAAARSQSRRPGTQVLPDLPPDEEEAAPEERKSSSGIWLTLVLLLMLAGGGYFMWPDIRDILGLSAPPRTAVPEAAAPPATAPGTSAVPEKSAGRGAAPPATKSKSAPSETLPAGVEAARSDLEARLQRTRIGQKIQVRASGDTIILAGHLTAVEMRLLEAGMRRWTPPAGVRLENRVQPARASLEGAPAAPTIGAEPDPETLRPTTTRGMGEVEVLTEAGAVATLKDSRNQVVATEKTPTRFEDLPPGRYALEVSSPGFKTEKRIVNVRAGNISKVEVTLKAEASGIRVEGKPDRAEVLVNGKKYGELTPTTIFLPPGTHTISVQKAGYEGIQQTVDLKAEELRRLSFDLPAKPGAAPGWGYLEVRTIPRGADILIDDQHSGNSPHRLELRPGRYSLTLYLRGFREVRRTVVIEAGKTEQVNAPLEKQP